MPTLRGSITHCRRRSAAPNLFPSQLLGQDCKRRRIRDWHGATAGSGQPRLYQGETRCLQLEIRGAGAGGGGGGAGAVRGWWRTSCTQRDAHRGSVPCWLAQRRFLQQGGELAGKAVPPGMPSSFVAPLAAKLGVKKNQSHFVLSDARGPGS